MHVPTSPSTSARSGHSVAPTLATALVAIDCWADLDTQRRALLKATLARIAEMLGEPANLIVLTPQFVRARLLTPSPSAFGISEGTMKNRRSLLRQVMERLDILDACDAPPSRAWEPLLAPLDSRQKAPLAKFRDFTALRGIEPEQVDDAIFSAFCIWLEEHTLVATPKKLAGSCRRAWNRVLHYAAGLAADEARGAE